MDNLRKCGTAPYRVALIHGGPGAPGSMAGLARLLSGDYGVLEPLQTADSVEGQIAELRELLSQYGHVPVALIGHSWGAWLSYFVAARHPELVSKLILVGSGPFTQEYVAQVGATRMSRMDGGERTQFDQLIKAMGSSDQAEKNAALASLGKLMGKLDSFAPLPECANVEPVRVDSDLYNSVWPQAASLRKSGELLACASQLQCPVVAIHGDYDPHPAQGVMEPLSRSVKDFRFYLLEKCGHTPWEERHARDRFLELLHAELN